MLSIPGTVFKQMLYTSLHDRYSIDVWLEFNLKSALDDFTELTYEPRYLFLFI